MVEGAQIDKQSHPNNASGTIWDVIELDQAVGVARQYAAAHGNTLVVTADHDQSMSILGTNEIDQGLYTSSQNSTLTYMSDGSGPQTANFFHDSPANVRSSYPYSASGGDGNTSGKSRPPTLAGQYQDPNNGMGFPNYVEYKHTGYPDNVNHSPGEGDIRLSVGYRKGNHTGSSVPITAEGPGAFLFIGYMDQTDVMFKIATAISSDTTEGDNFVKNVLLNPKYPATPGK